MAVSRASLCAALVMMGMQYLVRVLTRDRDEAILASGINVGGRTAKPNEEHSDDPFCDCPACWERDHV